MFAAEFLAVFQVALGLAYVLEEERVAEPGSDGER